MTGTSLPTAPQAGFYPPPPPPGFGYPYQNAGFVERFLAAIIDLIVLGLITVLVALPLGLLTAFAVLSNGSAPAWLGLLWGPFSLLLFFAFILFFTLFESTSGRTPGKRILGLRVLDLSTGQPPELAKALVRNVVRVIDWMPFLYLLGFVVAAITSRRQRLGDVLAGTIVVKG
jgi:uncharacterized RDD family membrane protein YckC